MDSEIPVQHLPDYLDYMDLDEKFFEIIDSFRSEVLWEKDDNGDWSLMHQVDF